MTQVHALLVLSRYLITFECSFSFCAGFEYYFDILFVFLLGVVQFVTVNAICKSCQNDEDCVDFCKDIHAKSVCENKFYDDSQSKCCVCMGK